MSTAPGPKMDEFVKKLVPDPASPPDTLLLSGFLGASSEENHTRLYFDMELASYIEIPDEAILHTEPLSADRSGLGGSYVWIKRDAEVIHGKVGVQRPKAKFFEGPIMQQYSGAAAMPGAPQAGAGAGMSWACSQFVACRMPSIAGDCELVSAITPCPVPASQAQGGLVICTTASQCCVETSVYSPCITNTSLCCWTTPVATCGRYCQKGWPDDWQGWRWQQGVPGWLGQTPAAGGAVRAGMADVYAGGAVAQPQAAAVSQIGTCEVRSTVAACVQPSAVCLGTRQWNCLSQLVACGSQVDACASGIVQCETITCPTIYCPMTRQANCQSQVVACASQVDVCLSALNQCGETIACIVRTTPPECIITTPWPGGCLPTRYVPGCPQPSVACGPGGAVAGTPMVQQQGMAGLQPQMGAMLPPTRIDAGCGPVQFLSQLAPCPSAYSPWTCQRSVFDPWTCGSMVMMLCRTELGLCPW